MRFCGKHNILYFASLEETWTKAFALLLVETVTPPPWCTYINYTVHAVDGITS